MSDDSFNVTGQQPGRTIADVTPTPQRAPVPPPQQPTPDLPPPTPAPVNLSPRPVTAPVRRSKTAFSWRRAGLFVVVVAVLAGVITLTRALTPNNQPQDGSLNSTRLKPQTTALATLSQELSKNISQTINTLTVNGQLSVTNSIILQPSARPDSMAAGQLYYDQTLQQLGYFNGQDVVYLQNGGGGTVTNVTNVTNAAAAADPNLAKLNATQTFTGINTFSSTTRFQNTIGVNLNSTEGAQYDITLGGGADRTIGVNQNPTTGAGHNLTIQAGTGAAGNNNGGNLNLQGGAATGSGASGSITLQTAAATNPTGSINIITGNSATAASGNITLDNGSGIISGVVVSTKTFEAGTDNMVGWFGATVAQSPAQAHQGANSLAATTTNAFWGIQEDNNTPGTLVISGHQYLFSAWVRAATTPRSISGSISWAGSNATANFNTTTDNTTGWVQMTLTVQAPAGATAAYFRFQSSGAAVGEVHYFDDFSVTDLSSASAFSSLSLGATNAKIVTIGNMNQIGATTISGGSGVTVQSGNSSMSLTGGTISITGAAASTLQTTAGGLTIDAGAAITIGATNATAITLGHSGTNITTTVNGLALFKPTTGNDSATAFQVQKADGTALLVADTTAMRVTVASLVVSTTLTVNGHIITGGTTPGIAAGAAACTTPTVSIAGTDTAGKITVATGTGCAASGILATITFASAFGAAPRVILTPAEVHAAGLSTYVDGGTISTTAFALDAAATPTSSTTYSWFYQVLQ